MLRFGVVPVPWSLCTLKMMDRRAVERAVTTSPPFMAPAMMRTLPYHSASAYAEKAMKKTNPSRQPLTTAACVPT